MESGVSLAPEDNWLRFSAGPHQSILFRGVLVGLTLGIKFERGNCAILLGDVLKVTGVIDDQFTLVIDDPGADEVVVRFGIFYLALELEQNECLSIHKYI